MTSEINNVLPGWPKDHPAFVRTQLAPVPETVAEAAIIVNGSLICNLTLRNPEDAETESVYRWGVRMTDTRMAPAMLRTMASNLDAFSDELEKK